MKLKVKSFLCLAAALFLFGAATCAAQSAIPKGLTDSTPNTAVLTAYDDWYAAEAKPNEAKIASKTIFTSPRCVFMLRDGGKGTLAKSHFHSTTDEIVVVMGGSGELLINGEWKQVKAGDVHINPRGNIHATRVAGSDDLKFVSIFTPVLPSGGDANFLTDGKAPVIPVGLSDSKPPTAVLANFQEWYKVNAKPEDPKIASQTIFTSPRVVVMLRDGGKGTLAKSHFHSTTDEIVIVMGGSGEILINGEWKQVKAGDVHVNPRGNVHATRVGADEDLQFVSIFTPALPAGGDANFLE